MRKGFTLIELMVVVAIMGMLATIIIGSVNGAKASARDIRRVSDIKAIQIALTSYFNDNNHYPCDIYSGPAGSGCSPSFLQAQYMADVPYDPVPASNGAKVKYTYTALNANTANPGSTNCGFGAGSYVASYHLGAALESLSPSITSADKDETIAAETSPFLYGACSGTSFFEGNAKGGTGLCGGTVVAGQDWCYDMGPDI